MAINSAGEGAIAGASIGALGGPIGAAAGGLIGGLYGHFSGGGSNPLNRSNNEFRDVDQNNFMLPGYAERQGMLSGYAQGAQGRNFLTGPSSFRMGQGQLANLLMQQAQGQGPSAAQGMLQNALQQNVSQQQALLASGRPGQQAAMARQASMQGSALGGSLANQAAQARVQEQLGAQSMLGNVLQGARGQDLSYQGLGLQQAAMNDAQQQAMLEMELRNAIAQQQGGQAYEGARTSRFNAMLGVPTTGEQLLGAGTGLLGAYMSMKGRQG